MQFAMAFQQPAQKSLRLTIPKSIMETCNVVLAFESVDEILWCAHSCDTSSAVLFFGAILFFSILQKLMIFAIFLEF